MEQKRVAHNHYQRQYFDTVDRPRLAIGESRYVLAHLERVIVEAELKPGQRILEVGAGSGKFTLPLINRGFEVLANDLSPVLLEKLHQVSDGRIKTQVGDIAEITLAKDEAPFDRVVGFFVLHHLCDFKLIFTALAKVMRPGGRIVFCEPIAWNPLYYLQIMMTPTMRFAGEPSLMSMRPGVILPMLQASGFIDVKAHGYGYFPPVLKNHSLGNQIENWLNQYSWIPFPHAFQLFSANLPEK
jgi:SAM-dependent methyltransferase